MIWEPVLAKFKELFGDEGEIGVYFAPGRVNMIGEHTDYNGGHVFPCALTIGTYGVARKRNDKKLRFYSMNFGHLPVIESSLDDLKPRRNAGWTNYPKGVMWALCEKGYELPCGIDLMLFGNIPNGSGLSSSASVEILTGYILNDLFQLGISNQDLALLGQFSENHFNGVNCGIMDQFASVFGKAGSLIRLDCRSLEYQYFPFDPQGYRLVLVDSVVKHELASSAYNKRRQSCEAAVAAVQKKHPHVEFLRDVTMGMLEEAKADISAEDYMRAEYVIEEIQRVLDVCDALEKGDYETVGQKMYETHHGMSKLYEVSCEELDFLNDLAFDCGVTGSRVMGGGFGGCTINLVKDELYSTFIEKAKDEFKKKFGRSPKVYDVVISDGARRLE
mgnify:CR=1 FL=1